MKTLKEVKKHFKNAKEVKCLTDGEISDITKKRINDIHFDDGCFWVTMAKNKNGSINLYRSKTDKFAEIISYKSTKEKTPKQELKALLNLAKECLEQPDSVVCKEYKGKILDACPSLKKEDEVLEIGQWYNYDWGHASGLFFITKFDNKKVKGYGFLENKWHDNRNDVTYMGHNTYGDWKKADPKKVEELLIKEAKKRGYKDGNYKCLHNGTYTHSDEYTYDSKENSLFSGWFDNRRNVIFQKGKWAEIIETISLSEAEKILKEKLDKDVKIKID